MPLIAGTAILTEAASEAESQQVAPEPASPAPDNEQQATLPRHKDASGLHVLSTMTIQQSCHRGLSWLDIIDAGVRLEQSGRATQTSSISANSVSWPDFPLRLTRFSPQKLQTYI